MKMRVFQDSPTQKRWSLPRHIPTLKPNGRPTVHYTLYGPTSKDSTPYILALVAGVIFMYMQVSYNVEIIGTIAATDVIIQHWNIGHSGKANARVVLYMHIYMYKYINCICLGI